MVVRRNRKIKIASAGNRTRAARVAGEHSTTEPPMLLVHSSALRLVIVTRSTIYDFMSLFNTYVCALNGLQ